MTEIQAIIGISQLKRLDEMILKRNLNAKYSFNQPIIAPIKKGQIIGKLNISYNENIIGEYDLLAANNVKKVNMFSRLMKSINYLIWGDV